MSDMRLIQNRSFVQTLEYGLLTVKMLFWGLRSNKYFWHYVYTILSWLMAFHTVAQDKVSKMFMVSSRTVKRWAATEEEAITDKRSVTMHNEDHSILFLCPIPCI